MPRPFGYEGKPLTCLWCGRRFRERTHTITYHERQRGVEVPNPGDLFGYAGVEHEVERVVKVVSKRRGSYPVENESEEWLARDLDRRTSFRVYFVEKRWDAYYSTDPMFDTGSCATAFGIRLAELGHRLVKTEG